MYLIEPNIISLHFFDILLPKTMDVETLDQNYLQYDIDSKRNFYKDLIVVIACLVVGVSCFLSLECVIKVTRKELLEWSNILLPFFFNAYLLYEKLSSRNRNILKKDIISQKICSKQILMKINKLFTLSSSLFSFLQSKIWLQEGPKIHRL